MANSERATRAAGASQAVLRVTTVKRGIARRGESVKTRKIYPITIRRVFLNMLAHLTSAEGVEVGVERHRGEISAFWTLIKTRARLTRSALREGRRLGRRHPPR